MDNCVQPQEWRRDPVVRNGINTSVWFGFRAIGSDAYYSYSASVTTGDITLKAGTNSTTATTVLTLDVSSSTYNTVTKCIRAINLLGTFEAWPSDFLPNQNLEMSAGSGRVVGIANTAIKGVDEVLIYQKTDKTDDVQEHFSCGLTEAGPSNGFHNSDAQVCHEIMQVTVQVTFATNAVTIALYAVNDKASTYRLIEQKAIATASSATEIKFPNTLTDNPYFSISGERLVVDVTGGCDSTSSALRSPVIRIARRSYVFGPAIPPLKHLSRF